MIYLIVLRFADQWLAVMIMTIQKVCFRIIIHRARTRGLKTLFKKQLLLKVLLVVAMLNMRYRVPLPCTLGVGSSLLFFAVLCPAFKARVVSKSSNLWCVLNLIIKWFYSVVFLQHLDKNALRDQILVPRVLSGISAIILPTVYARFLQFSFGELDFKWSRSFVRWFALYSLFFSEKIA